MSSAGLGLWATSHASPTTPPKGYGHSRHFRIQFKGYVLSFDPVSVLLPCFTFRLPLACFHRNDGPVSPALFADCIVPRAVYDVKQKLSLDIHLILLYDTDMNDTEPYITATNIVGPSDNFQMFSEEGNAMARGVAMSLVMEIVSGETLLPEKVRAKRDAAMKAVSKLHGEIYDTEPRDEIKHCIQKAYRAIGLTVEDWW